ncbi:MAG TPA: signal recognition particle protein [Oligoflexia bacterium]|nr:signal recognition particle protein [Oligoflexia bacterium]HMR25436.1 signal recognition particle protein [Oligoflexia bacterium]
MFESLQEKLSSTLKSLQGKGKISESNITEALKEVRKSLLEADVQYNVVQSIIDSVKKEVLGDKVLLAVDPGQQFIKSVYDELRRVLGQDTPEFPKFGSKPVKILMMGLQGTGKTTTVGKLGHYIRDDLNAMPYMIPADTSRPAAIDQLKAIGQEHGFHVYDHNQSNAIDVCKDMLKKIKGKEVPGQYFIFDTAGRLAVDTDLMDELKQIKNIVEPDLVLYVLDAMAGQSALETAQEFQSHVGFDGVIVSKLDGDSRGGALISVKQSLEVPVYFLGTGEKVENIERMHPDRMASRILGMGDIVSLVEKAQKVIDEKQAQAMAKKMRKNQFTIEDFADQMRNLQKMGGIDALMGMLPGAAQIKKNLPVGVEEKQMKTITAIIDSMTPKERRNHQLIDGSRRKRIANGSGTSVQDVNRFLKQFLQAKKMMSKMGKMGAKGFARSNMFGSR